IHPIKWIFCPGSFTAALKSFSETLHLSPSTAPLKKSSRYYLVFKDQTPLTKKAKYFYIYLYHRCQGARPRDLAITVQLLNAEMRVRLFNQPPPPLSLARL
ncbi:MAG TPA: hypothetical protein VNL14_21675, partial [Candidatus Acidoferrales bacterium]|nr:hypothetical protein [Candidatus Acidoferrales bacterium]